MHVIWFIVGIAGILLTSGSTVYADDNVESLASASTKLQLRKAAEPAEQLNVAESLASASTKLQLLKAAEPAEQLNVAEPLASASIELQQLKAAEPAEQLNAAEAPKELNNLELAEAEAQQDDSDVAGALLGVDGGDGHENASPREARQFGFGRSFFGGGYGRRPFFGGGYGRRPFFGGGYGRPFFGGGYGRPFYGGGYGRPFGGGYGRPFFGRPCCFG